MNKKSLGKSAWRFLKTLRPWRVAVSGALVLAVLSTVCGIFGPKLLGQMTDVAVESFQGAVEANGGELPDSEVLREAIDWGRLGGIAVTLGVLYVVAAVLNYIQGAILSIISARYAEKMRSEILAKVMRLPMSYFDRTQVGDTLARMSNDVGMVANTLSSVLSQIITSATMLVGILVMMMTISPVLALVALVVVPVSLVAIAMVARKAQKYFRTQQTTIGELNSVVEEDYAGQILVKVNSYGERAKREFETVNMKLYQTAWRAQFYASLAHPLTHVFTNLNYVLICVLGGQMAADGKLMIGGVQAFIQYVSQFNKPITEVSHITAQIQQTIAAAERIFDFLDEQEEVPDAVDALKPQKVRGEVEFHQVGFRYHENEPLIENFSVKIEPGMQVAIVGPTGAGKTTIINLLMRFYDPVSGYITIDGVPTREMRRADVRSLFGMVLQDTWLFSGTIEENLCYGNPKATHEEVVTAAKTCHVDHFIQSLSREYQTEIGEDSDNISAGEKQLLTIVRAMVANPPMMILDEATSNVDTRTEQLIQEAMMKLMRGRTSFVIAHRLSTIRNADLILVMKEGRIVEQGRHEELMAKGGFYAELYNSQFDGA